MSVKRPFYLAIEPDESGARGTPVHPQRLNSSAFDDPNKPCASIPARIWRASETVQANSEKFPLIPQRVGQQFIDCYRHLPDSLPR